MSYTAANAWGGQPAPPVWLPALRAGETDGRFIDTSLDLGAVDDYIPSIGNLTVQIARADEEPMTADDLQPAGNLWPNRVDPNGLVITLGLTAPLASAGVTYFVTLIVNPTAMGRLWIRDLALLVSPYLG
jgi:hypothetical protein